MTFHANGDVVLNSNSTSEFIKLDTKRNELFSNVNIDLEQHLIAGESVYVKDGKSINFGAQMTINDTTSTEGTLLFEDGTASDSGTDNGSFLLEDLASDRLASNSTGMIFGGMILDGTQISSANGVINLGDLWGHRKWCNKSE